MKPTKLKFAITCLALAATSGILFAQPVVNIPPASRIVFAGSTVTFTVDASDVLSYQWMAGGAGTGVYTNLSNDGPFSGTDSPTLTITNVTKVANQGDYVVVVTNDFGSVTSSPPATLTVSAVLYQENFNLPVANQINAVGWRNDVKGALDSRIYGAGGDNRAVFSFTPNAANEVYFTSTILATGAITNQMPFRSINLAVVENLLFSVDLNSGWHPELVHSYFAVQMNWGSWYVSTNELLPIPTGTFATYNMVFNPAASGWLNLTVSPNGSVDNASYGVIGAAAGADLSGYITGAGLVCVHDGSSTHNLDNFTIAGAVPPVSLPVIDSPPFTRTNYTGTEATFNVSATSNGFTAGLTYQWKAGTVGSGVYANMTNGGQFSGTTSSTLQISNVTSAANHKDYVVVVTDGAGSVTSTPPATLTVVDSKPVLVADTTISPNAVHAGNNNIITLTAAFAGSLPITYHWQTSLNANGSGAVNVANATNSTLTLSDPQTNRSGYYSLQAVNGVSPTPTNSAWTQLTVSPESTAFFHWQAPVFFGSLNATQILNGPLGTRVGAEVFGTPGTVIVGDVTFDFVADLTVATLSGAAGPGTGPGTFIGFGTTGDPNLDAIIDQTTEVTGTPEITLHNLTVGLPYSAQFFAVDHLHDPTRPTAFADPNDLTDVSRIYLVGDDTYMIGTFVATNTDITVRQFLPNGHGYFNAVVIRALPPTLTIQRGSGADLQLIWNSGTLLEATSIAGPWTTNALATSPHTVTPTGPQKFFRVQAP